MKKVLFNTPTGVSIESINDDSIIGLIFPSSPKEKTWIVENKEGNYFGFGIGDTSISSKWIKNSIKEYCITANQQNAEIFVFDTEKELIEWLKS